MSRREFSKSVMRGVSEHDAYTYAHLTERFAYDEENGDLKWMERPREHFSTNRGHRCFNTREANKTAGSIQKNGYIYVRVDGQFLLVHRIAYVLGTKSDIPDGMQVDHINGIKSDNRLANLRLATKSQNGVNRGPNKGRLLPKNVYYEKSRDKYSVQFTCDYKTIHGGRFASVEEAERRAREMRDNLHREYANHGDSR